MAGQVDRQRGLAEPDDHGVPGVGVLPAAVQVHHLGRFVAPLQRADGPRLDASYRRQRPAHPDLLGVLVQQRELVEAGQVVVGEFGVGHAVDSTIAFHSASRAAKVRVTVSLSAE